eukprot:TRINITY_DN94060_c0_g1_i1.p1 TRINITY_DN94060_c0_g1~~TRINITY_DN94060_c0_g1_i1.p1  ORF type:complete len:222 (+),score=86.25 TRINITY_DN94060_c0_g1_i1:39-668(+)
MGFRRNLAKFLRKYMISGIHKPYLPPVRPSGESKLGWRFPDPASQEKADVPDSAPEHEFKTKFYQRTDISGTEITTDDSMRVTSLHSPKPDWWGDANVVEDEKFATPGQFAHSWLARPIQTENDPEQEPTSQHDVRTTYYEPERVEEYDEIVAKQGQFETDEVDAYMASLSRGKEGESRCPFTRHRREIWEYAFGSSTTQPQQQQKQKQ